LYSTRNFFTKAKKAESSCGADFSAKEEEQKIINKKTKIIMKNFKEFGTLLTREESKEIKGGYDSMIVVGGKEDGGGASATCSAQACQKGLECKLAFGSPGVCRYYEGSCGCFSTALP